MISKPLVIDDLIIEKADGKVSGSALYGVANLDHPLEALDASVTLSIDGASSSATIRLAPGTSVDGRCYVEMFTILGSAGVFRTRSPQTGYGSQNTMLNLEHAVNQLGDCIINDKYEAELTVKAAMKKIFSYYSEKFNLWQLGTVETPIDEDGEELDPKCVLSIDHDNCLDAISGVMEQYPNMMMEFNFKARPWKLHIRNRETEVTAEGRLTRNIKSAVVVRDDSELFTRVYMDGYKNSGNKFGAYNSAYYQKKYGLIETVISGANDTPAIAARTVKNYLKKHRKPRYSINIEGIVLSDITGESFDKFTLGKQMRLALAKYNTTVTETITSITFPSVYKTPKSCSIVLADENDTVIRYIKKAQKTAAKAGSSAKAVGRAAIIDAVVQNNILTLTKGDGTQVNFSKAVTLEDGWSGGRYTVKVKQTQIEDGKKVEHEVATAETKLNGITLQANKQPSVTGVYDLSIPLKVMYDNGLPESIGNKSNTEYAEDVVVTAKAVYEKGQKAATLTGSWSGGIFTAKNAFNENNKVKTQIFDLTSSDVEWSGRNGTIKVYANINDGETKIDTGKRLHVTAPVQHPTLSGSWSGGILTVTANPSAQTNLTVQICDLTNSDVTWSGLTGTIKVYANFNGSETKQDTGKRLTVTAPFTSRMFTKAYDTDDSIYYGRLYRSDGTPLTSGSFYWYGYNTNLSAGQGQAQLYTHN